MDESPLKQFEKWFNIAKSQEKVLEPNMMAVSTMGLDGYPNSRYVLLKEVRDGQFVFYSNYQSQKGKELEKNNKVALLFYWPSKYWSVRIQGEASKAPAAESDQYFLSRPIGSQAGAICSHQSQLITDNKEKLVISYQLGK